MLFKSVKYLLFQIRRRRQKMNSGFFGFLSFIFSLLLSFVQGRLCFCFHPLTHWTEGCFWLRSSSTGTSACCRSALLEGTVKWGPNIPPCLCPGKLSACELWPLLLPSILLRRTSPLFYSLVCELGHSGFEHLGFFQNFSDGFHETIDSSCVSAQLQSLLSVKYQFSDVMGDEPSSFNRNSEIEMITLNHFWSLRAALTNTPYCAFISLTLVYPGEVWKAAMITYWLKFRAAAKKTVTPALVVSKLPPLTPDNNNISLGFVYPPRHLVVQRFLFFFSGINVVFQSQESAWMKLNMSQRSTMIVIDYLNKRWKYMTEDTNLN